MPSFQSKQSAQLSLLEGWGSKSTLPQKLTNNWTPKLPFLSLSTGVEEVTWATKVRAKCIVFKSMTWPVPWGFSLASVRDAKCYLQPSRHILKVLISKVDFHKFLHLIYAMERPKRASVELFLFPYILRTFILWKCRKKKVNNCKRNSL